jgi:subtilase family serine protease
MNHDRLRCVAVSLLALLLAAAPSLFAQDSSSRTIPNSKYGFVSTAKDLGPEESSKQVTVYLWLQLHNVDALRELVEQQSEPDSGNYRNWVRPEQFSSTYAPTAEDVATVKAFLVANHLTVSGVGQLNMYVKAQGSIGDVQSAFSVQIHRFDVHGHIYRANTTDPVMEGPAGALVSRVGGLSDYQLQPHVMRPINPQSGKPFDAVPLSAVPNGAFFSPNCLEAPQLVNFSTDGSRPKATYFGNTYGAPITNSTPGTLAPCGYQPSDLQTAYKLTDLYNANLTGAGQTVVVIDAYGSPTLGTDAATYASFYGLGPLNLSVYYACPAPTDGVPGCPTPQDEGWALETTLDVETVHAIAPGANIALVYAYSNETDDLGAAILAAVANGLGNVISNSYGGPESQLMGTPYTPFDDILLVAASMGVAVNFSSGDSGDFSPFEGFTDVNYPASSSYATGVGGTSLFLNKNKTMAFQTGWGNNLTLIAAPPDAAGYDVPLVPPDSSATDGFGFEGGSGGGTSGVYHKPSFQRGLPGRYRLVPDISFLADDFTGLEIFCTGSSCFGVNSSDIYVGVVGGTSLACPMFSSVWSMAVQLAGQPLGQPARSIYRLPANAITDVVPVGSPLDVAGIITVNNHDILLEGPFQLVAPETWTPFVSALFNSTIPGIYDAWTVISFGTDTSLATSRGWDNVTGLGTPNGLPFVQEVAR